MSRTI